MRAATLRRLALFAAVIAFVASCEQRPAGEKTPATNAVAKKPHPETSRKSSKYTPTLSRHIPGAKVVAVDAASITLFLDTNCSPLDVKGWQVRQFPAADMLAKGDIHEWAGDMHAYGLADVQIGDILNVGILIDAEDKLAYVYEIGIEERPGGLVPPSRRPEMLVHCPPNQFLKSDRGAYHTMVNVANDLRDGRPVPDELLRLVRMRRPAAPPAKQ